MTKTSNIARLKITLDYVEPKVMRRIDVPLGIKLDRLHLVIQAAMGWTNSHLWSFEAGGVSWAPDMMEFGDALPASKSTLLSIIDDIGTKTIHYIYDYGDNWDHTIKVERVGNAEPGALYPRLVKAEGRCPPEDIGGPPGYEMYLEAIADPEHEERDWMLECHGEPQDPTNLTSRPSQPNSNASQIAGSPDRENQPCGLERPVTTVPGLSESDWFKYQAAVSPYRGDSGLHGKRSLIRLA